MPKVYFVNEIVEVEASSGQTVQEVATAAGITLYRGFWTWANCRSYGLCGSCKVWAKPLRPGALSDKGFLERIKPGVRGTIRLGCQARILGDCEITTKPGGPPVAETTTWEPDPRPARGKERAAAKGSADEEVEAGAAPKAPKSVPAAGAQAAGDADGKARKSTPTPTPKPAAAPATSTASPPDIPKP